MRTAIFAFLLVAFVSTLTAQIPNGYYSTATGTGYALKTQLYDIIKGHADQGYEWTFFNANDRDFYYENDGSILDLYSENPSGYDPYNFTVTTDQCGTYSNEGDCYNREHSFPQSWFNDAYPMRSDVHHLFASDGKVNGMRSNYPFGEVSSASYTSGNGSRLGTARSGLGYSGTVFEPIDEFKGDLARAYFYMATRYQNLIAGWETNSTESNIVLNGTSDQVYEDWVITMLMDWHINDPVSQKEIDRNNAAYTYQGNRNPFVDHPEYVNAIWGDGTITPTPTISTTSSAGGYNFGSIVAGNSSASVNYKVIGSDLEGDVTVSVSSPFQVSLNNSSWSGSVVVSKLNAEANTSNTVYVRFSPSTANGQTYTSSVSHSSAGASTVTVNITGKEGEISAGSGVIVLNTSSFNGDFGQTLVGSNSIATGYSVSASNLNENLIITAPDNFRISLQPSSGYSTSIELPQSGGAIGGTTIYVVFAPGVEGSQGGDITHISSGANESVSVLGFGVKPLTNTSGDSNILIYPNPADGFVEITGVNWKETTVRIFDSRGYRLPVRFKDGKIDVSEFPAGMYYFTFTGKGNPILHKVILK